jgi:hypothetical protein
MSCSCQAVYCVHVARLALALKNIICFVTIIVPTQQKACYMLWFIALLHCNEKIAKKRMYDAGRMADCKARLHSITAVPNAMCQAHHANSVDTRCWSDTVVVRSLTSDESPRVVGLVESVVLLCCCGGAGCGPRKRRREQLSPLRISSRLQSRRP